MPATNDPFHHHPDLRGLVRDPETSFFRSFRPEDLDPLLAAHGVEPGWRLTDDAREACRRAALSDHPGGDLWIFGYGSLIWDPALRFAEVRRARLDGFRRSFCLLDTLGGRGTAAAPGLMAALDTGGACSGIAFRISEPEIDRETEILWRRERVAPGYRPHFASVEIDDGIVRALTFVADHGAAIVRPDLTLEQQADHLATGAGFLGSGLDYIDNIAANLAALGIEDADLTRLRAAAHARAAAIAGG